MSDGIERTGMTSGNELGLGNVYKVHRPDPDAEGGNNQSFHDHLEEEEHEGSAEEEEPQVQESSAKRSLPIQDDVQLSERAQELLQPPSSKEDAASEGNDGHPDEEPPSHIDLIA